MSLDEIKNLPVIERIQAMEILWDSLCHDNEAIKSPDWHTKILENRREMLVSGQARFISLTQLKDL